VGRREPVSGWPPCTCYSKKYRFPCRAFREGTRFKSAKASPLQSWHVTTIVLKRWHWFLFAFLWLTQLFGWWEMLKHTPDRASVLHLLHSFGWMGYVWAASLTAGSAFITTVIWVKLLEVFNIVPQERNRLPSTVKTVIFWLVIVISAFLLWQAVKSGGEPRSPEISYSEFLSQVESGNVRKVTISKTRIIGTYRDGRLFRVFAPMSQDALLQTLHNKNVEIWIKDTDEGNWPSWLLNIAPLVLLAALWFFMIRQMKRGIKS
jgi:hypothetical protein